MKKYTILLGYFDKQLSFIDRIYNEIVLIDVTSEEMRYKFALKVQQLYTAIEDLLKQVAKSFENHIKNLSQYHNELLIRLNTQIPNIRPALLSKSSFLYLNKLRAFHHFIRHAYDVELDENELLNIKQMLESDHAELSSDFNQFREYVVTLSR